MVTERLVSNSFSDRHVTLPSHITVLSLVTHNVNNNVSIRFVNLAGCIVIVIYCLRVC